MYQTYWVPLLGGGGKGRGGGGGYGVVKKASRQGRCAENEKRGKGGVDFPHNWLAVGVETSKEE